MPRDASARQQEDFCSGSSRKVKRHAREALLRTHRPNHARAESPAPD